MSKSWLLSKGYPQGAVWSVLTCLVSVSNDVITKFVGTRLDGLEISFFRFLFSMITILPFMIPHGINAFKTRNPMLHVWRGIIGVVAIALYIYSLIKLPLAEVTTFSFTQPLLFLPLAIIFLGEKIHQDRWVAAILGFIGILILLKPGQENFNFYALLPIGAALCFASLDILAKKMVSSESTMTMLFYFAFATTLAALIPAISVWQTPTLKELFFLFFLGAGANLIQVCLFRAFSATDASSLAPFRYVELVFSVTFGILFFQESPSFHTLIGAGIIIASTLYMSYRETKRQK